MPIEILVLFFGGLFGIGGIILVGQHLERTRSGSGVSTKQVEKLREAMESLQGEVRTLQDDVVELNERVEFNERLLERPHRGDGEEGQPLDPGAAS